MSFIEQSKQPKLEEELQITGQEKDDLELYQQKTETMENQQADEQVNSSLDVISNSNIVRVYDKDGKSVFSGNSEQLMTFWKNKDYGVVENIGNISDEEGKSIIRFGPANGHGFVDRGRISELFQQLETKNVRKKSLAVDQQKIAELRQELGLSHAPELSPQQKEELIQGIKGIYNEASMKHKMTLQFDMQIMANGVNPYTGEKFFDKTDGAIGQFFEAHGIAKDEQLTKLLGLLEKGVDPDKSLYVASFEVPNENRVFGSTLGTSGGAAYQDGIAVLTSGYKENISANGIKHVFVNDIYSDLKEPLSKLFPQYQVHLLSEQKEVMENEAKLFEKK